MRSIENIDEVYGPQSRGDNLFTAKARLLQSIYRVQTGEVMGIGPNSNSVGKDGKPSYYGNMLMGGKLSGKNFFFQETFDYANERVESKNRKAEETIGEYRLFNNLLSSMPMAFNLFHPLMMVKKLFPDALNLMVKDLFPGLPVYHVDEIRIEFIPTPTTAYTLDKSAMDAAILFSDQEKNQFIIAIETKYTDNLGLNLAKNDKVKYRVAEDSGLFTKDGLIHIKDGCTQIYRNFLLTEKYRMVHRLKDSYSIVLAPKDHPSTDSEIRSLIEFLHPQHKYKLKKYALEDFVFALEKNCPDEFKNWLNRFYDRYLDFEKIASILNEPKQQ